MSQKEITKKVEKKQGTILDYIKEYGQYSFAERPLGEVDSLILSQFAYLKFDGIVPLIHEMGKSVTLQNMKNHAHFENLFADERWRDGFLLLFEAMSNSKRFSTMRCNYFVNIIEAEHETQFAAITYVLDDGTVYVAFRGTDETLIGWKEDLNMLHKGSVPGQRMSADYLNQISQKIRSPFYVGGHSKGGNLAVYSSVHCYPNVRGMIRGIYDHDGPGFRDDISQLPEYQEIKAILYKSIPHSSVVGVLLNRNDASKIVASKKIGMAQHDPFSWLIADGAFVELEHLGARNRRVSQYLKNAVTILSEQEIELIIEEIYQVLLGSGEDNLIDMKNHWQSAIKNMRHTLRDADPETKKKVLKIAKQLFEYSLMDMFEKKE